jgi:Tol biopolymer transport system component
MTCAGYNGAHVGPSTGRKLGPYEIIAPLGAGGMGEVYRARDRTLKRDVAVKVLPSYYARDPDRLRRFEQEAQAVAALNHPNILSIYHVGQENGCPYIVTELLEGETLRDSLRHGALRLRSAVDYGVQVARGLAVAHEKGIVHRDLKPENLFITKDGRVKILDFGLAKLAQPEGTLEASSPTLGVGTEAGAVLGTLGYMSPEQVRGKKADARSDIFSLGAVMYEMLTGQRAFKGETAADTLTTILKEDPPALAGKNGDLPPALERIVRRCLEKSPEQRFQSASDLGFALESASGISSSPPIAVGTRTGTTRTRRLVGAAAFLLAVVAAGFLGYRYGVRTSATVPEFRSLTFGRGMVTAARFAPDGQTIVYAAAWNGNHTQLYMTRPEGPESRPLELIDGNLFAVSVSGELAVSIGCKMQSLATCGGTLASMPLSGGAPRELMEDVYSADWSPDGQGLAFVHQIGGHYRVEYPAGKLIFDTTDWISSVRVSPSGDMVAFVVHPLAGDDQGSVMVLDREGKSRVTSAAWASVQGVAWSPSGQEVWFCASNAGWANELHALNVSGHERMLLRFPGITRLHDISRDGHLLLSKEQWRASLAFRGPEKTWNRDLSWLDLSTLSDLSRDGRLVVFSEAGQAVLERTDTYVRRTDGSPAVRLGEGGGGVLSPDQKWALVATTKMPDQFVLLPIGVGEKRYLEPYGIIRHMAWGWFPDAQQVAFAGSETGHEWRLYVQPLSGGKPRVIAPEIAQPGAFDSQIVSGDGKFAWARDTDNHIRLYPVDGSPPRLVPGIAATDVWMNWGPDSNSAYVFRSNEIPARVFRVNLTTGQRTFVTDFNLGDVVGLSGLDTIRTTPDGKSFAYSYNHALSELYLVTGLK